MRKRDVRRCIRAAALATCALLTGAAHAQSSLQIYGQVDVWTGKSRPIGQADRTWMQGAGGMQTNFWGIKGSENLGNGVEAIFALESFYRADTGAGGRFTNDTLFSRSAYVGLKGAYGTVALGRNTTPYWLSTVLFNPMVSSFSFSPAVLFSYGPNGSVKAPLIGDSGWSNSILYSIPATAGLTGSVLYSTGENGDGKHKAGGNLMYTRGAWAATVAYQQADFSSVPGDLGPAFDRQRATLVGATYDFKVVKLFGQVQRLEDELTTGDYTRRSYQVGVSVPVGKVSLLASYGNMRTRGAIRDERDTLGLVLDYHLSKRSDIYLGYLHDKVDLGGSGDTLGLGLRHYF